MSRQRRLAMLVQTGILKLSSVSSPNFVEAFDVVLQVPEESIPEDVARAAREAIGWIYLLTDFMGRPDLIQTPSWIAEWLEREQRPNPFA